MPNLRASFMPAKRTQHISRVPGPSMRLLTSSRPPATMPAVPFVFAGAGFWAMAPALAKAARSPGILLDNWLKGRRRAVWISKSDKLIEDAQRIPAALITGIRSDLPRQITAQVTENIFDSPTGRIKLVPQGARLIGVYDSQVAFGQSRVLLVWARLIMPNGRSI